jgi:allophanate hydrolase subunit 1
LDAIEVYGTAAGYLFMGSEPKQMHEPERAPKRQLQDAGADVEQPRNN